MSAILSFLRGLLQPLPRGLCGVVVFLLIGACQTGSRQSLSTETPTDTVWMRGLKFVPDTLYLLGETRVVFVNQDMVVHNVKSLDSSWGSPNLPTDSTWSHLIQQSTPYQCTLHPTMKGWIVITDNTSKQK
ncbi:hypothetical protein BXY57_0075 [Thermoflavifilum aggregans]|uniref:Plastocyanin n=1 Tax=Thermoflavifilum aggregans TaxID=454188 RepID=A0A2M9CRK2_9BACT|nr:hypothetical protein [Thermoflavifilum aggregans]PJJ74517.1 hypothetical protein BXY57_0075 [Thermoflavifilum aggregans]